MIEIETPYDFVQYLDVKLNELREYSDLDEETVEAIRRVCLNDAED